MNKTHKGLLDAVRKEPWDDGHRLVLADWLEDHGQEERAEFIRVQVEMAHWSCPPETGTGPCRRCPLEDRSWDLLGGRRRLACWPWPDNNQTRWLPRALVEAWNCRDGDGWRSHRGFDCEWDRGFVAKVVMGLLAFLKLAGAIFAEHPVTEVELLDRHPSAPPEVVGDDTFLQNPHWYRHCGDPDAYDHEDLFDPEDIPEPIFGLLRAGREDARYGGDRLFYPDEANAYADLSQACVRYGREAALEEKSGRRA